MFKYKILYKPLLNERYDTEAISKPYATMKLAFKEVLLEIDKLEKLNYEIGTCTVYSIEVERKKGEEILMKEKRRRKYYGN